MGQSPLWILSLRLKPIPIPPDKVLVNAPETNNMPNFETTTFLYVTTAPISVQIPRRMGDRMTLPVGASIELSESPEELAEISAESDYDGVAVRSSLFASWRLPVGGKMTVSIDVEEFRDRSEAVS